MGRNLERICENCNSKVFILEFTTGAPGGKTEEEVDCPKCGSPIFRAMTDGYFVKKIVE